MPRKATISLLATRSQPVGRPHTGPGPETFRGLGLMSALEIPLSEALPKQAKEQRVMLISRRKGASFVDPLAGQISHRGCTHFSDMAWETKSHDLNTNLGLHAGNVPGSPSVYRLSLIHAYEPANPSCIHGAADSFPSASAKWLAHVAS